MGHRFRESFGVPFDWLGIGSFKPSIPLLRVMNVAPSLMRVSIEIAEVDSEVDNPPVKGG